MFAWAQYHHLGFKPAELQERLSRTVLPRVTTICWTRFKMRCVYFNLKVDGLVHDE